MIGTVQKRVPEFDVGMVELTPANVNRYDNSVYFNAEPKRLIATSPMGQYCKVDSMSTGRCHFVQFLGPVKEVPTVCRTKLGGQ